MNKSSAISLLVISIAMSCSPQNKERKSPKKVMHSENLFSEYGESVPNPTKNIDTLWRDFDREFDYLILGAWRIRGESPEGNRNWVQMPHPNWALAIDDASSLNSWKSLVDHIRRDVSGEKISWLTKIWESAGARLDDVYLNEFHMIPFIILDANDINLKEYILDNKGLILKENGVHEKIVTRMYLLLEEK